MKRLMIILFVATVPALLFLNTWQTFRYDRLRSEVESLEEEQRYWLEENKRLLIGIEVLGSPQRIDELARGRRELEKADDRADMRIRLVPADGADD